MLEFIRSSVGSWAIKILFVLLIASFAVWGIGDIFRDGGLDQRVGKVGDQEISLAEVDQAFQVQLDNLRRQFDPTIEPTTAISLGALDQATQQVVSGALIDQAASDLELRASDEAIATTIAQNPNFQGLNGQFDPQVLRSVLAANGLTEERFLAITRQDTARGQVLGAATGNITPPETLLTTVFDYASERRTASYIHLQDDAFDEVPEPSSDTQQAYFEENKDLFQAPEYRRLTVVTLQPEDVFDQITISEEELAAAYGARRAEFDNPEVRDVIQLVVQDEALAGQLSELAIENGSIEAAREAIGQDVPETVSFNAVTKDRMLAPEIGEAAFALAEGAISEPVQSPFGWHVFEVTSVTPAEVQTLDDVRGLLETDLKSQQAGDVLFEMANQIIDSLAGGATLSEVAEQFALNKVNPVPVSRNGQPDLGDEAPSFPYQAEVIAQGFSLSEGQESLLEEHPEGGYYAVGVDEVIAPRDRAFEDVRDQVLEASYAAARSTARTEMAETITARLDEGDALGAIATDLELTVTESEALLRSNAGSPDLPITAIDLLFETDQGGHFSADTPAGQVIAVVTGVLPSDESEENVARRDQLANALSGALQVELAEQLSQALTNEHPVEINRDRLIQFYTAQDFGAGHTGM